MEVLSVILALDCILDRFGTATNLLSFAVGNAATRISAAVTLGGTSRANEPTEGALEYIGTADSVTTNRSVALAGNGRLTASGTGGLGWRGISGAGAGARTLTLGGAAQSGYSVSDVSDGANAPVSLVKTNAGATGGETVFARTADVLPEVLQVGKVLLYAFRRGALAGSADDDPHVLLCLDSFEEVLEPVTFLMVGHLAGNTGLLLSGSE